MYIVGFNGPPRSGKDTMARMLAEKIESEGCDIPVREMSLSTPLRIIAYAMTGWKGFADGENYEAFKTTHFKQFDRTGRQIMIDISESFLKPCYGQAIMAKLLLEQLDQFPGIVLLRDTGFRIEASHLAFAVGFNKLYIAQVRRPGCDFDNDSREWVHHAHMSEFNNNGSLDDLRMESHRLYGRLVNQMGWKL